MSKSQHLFILGILITLTVLLAACGGDDATATPEEMTASDVKVALLTFGLVTGDPWNALGYDGLQQAEEKFGVSTALTDNLTPPDFEGAMRDYASQDYNIVIGHSFGFGDSALAINEDFPNTFFTINTGAASADNVASFNMQDQENGYLTGALAALMSESGTIGILGGFDYPSVIKEINGYVDGAKSINPDIEILVGYVGSWDDPAGGQELAVAMIENGADVISAKAGGSGLGVYQAAEEAGAWAISDVATCQEVAPNACLSSTDIRFDNVVLKTVELYLNDELEGKIYNWGIADGAVDVGPIHKDVPKEHVDQIMDLRQQIIDGELTVPEKWEPGW